MKKSMFILAALAAAIALPAQAARYDSATSVKQGEQQQLVAKKGKKKSAAKKA